MFVAFKNVSLDGDNGTFKRNNTDVVATFQVLVAASQYRAKGGTSSAKQITVAS